MSLFRINPALPVQSYKTYGIKAPIATHHRKATCREVNCSAYANGWRTVIDVSTDLGSKQANYIRLHSGRSFTWSQTESVVEFTFPAGQNCFAEHTVPLEREPIFLTRGGDWRAQTSEANVMRGEDWLDDCMNNQDKLKTIIERG